MATVTENLGLEAPSEDDIYGIEYVEKNNKILDKKITEAEEHVLDTDNPHKVTKEQVGLAYADNTSDEDKPISVAQQKAFDEINKKIGVTDLSTEADTLIGAINEANSIAKGRNQSVSYENYEAMVNAFNNMDSEAYNVGQNIYIGITGVPDLWIYGIVAIKKTYTYTSDDDLVELISSNTYQQIGYYQIAFLETQKADLTELTTHLQNNSNPHGVTKAQVGLGNVPNVATNNQTPTYTVASALAELVSGEKLSVALGKIAKMIRYAISKFTSIDTEIEKLNSNLINLVTEERQLIGTITLASGEAVDYTVSVKKDGYTPIGIVGYTIKNTAMMYCYRCYIENTNCIFSIRNLQEISEVFGFSVFVLYRKN